MLRNKWLPHAIHPVTANYLYPCVCYYDINISLKSWKSHQGHCAVVVNQNRLVAVVSTTPDPHMQHSYGKCQNPQSDDVPQWATQVHRPRNNESPAISGNE